MIGERTLTNNTRTQDIQCILYAQLGFSMDVIQARTGLSKGAISYRLKLLGVKISDYRNGRTNLSQRVIEAATADSTKLMEEFRKHLAKVLPAPPK